MNVSELIWDYEKRILSLKKRYYYISAIIDELNKRTGGHKFQIKNDIFWLMLADSFSMLVIDLASLYRSLAEQGGFFGQLKIHSGKLRRTSYRKVEAPEPNIERDVAPEDAERIRREVREHFQRVVAKNMEKGLISLFPQLASDPNRSANHQDIDELKDRLMHRADDILDDRDNLRAHRFQNEEGDKAVGVSLKRVGEHFDYLEEFLNAVRIVTTSSTMSYNNTTSANVERTAQDIVDIICMGSIQQLFNEYGVPDALKNSKGPIYYHQFRDSFYSTNSQPFGKPDLNKPSK